MSFRSWSTVVLSLAASAAAAAAPAVWKLSLQSDHHGEALPLRVLGDDDAVRHLTPRQGRNLAYADDEVRLSRREGAWRWSALARSHATLVASHDALDLARQVANGERPATDRRWRTHLRYQAFSGAGLELERAFTPAANWHTSVSVQGLVLRHWRDRSLDGPVSFDAASATYAFDVQSGQADDRLDFPFQTPFASRGAGLLFGGAVGWDAKPWHVSLSVRDAGWLHWRNLPQQDLVLSTQTQSFDADGFLIYRPLINGRNHQAGHTRGMPGRWRAAVGWQADERSRLELSSDWVAGFGALPAVAAQRRFGEVDLGLAWRFHERRATLSLGWRGWQLRLGADRLGASARSREASVAGRFAF